MTATSRAPAAAPSLGTVRAAWRTWLGHPGVGMAVALLGSLTLVVAGTLPVWGTRLMAPQYPKGLDLWFYGGHVEGPVREVNGLNHYIGMQPIDITRVPEMQLWPLAILSAAALLVAAVLWRGWLGRLALLGLWLIPVTVLADIQRWLIIFASELDDTAALRVGGFIPLVVGPTRVWNFTVLTYPGMALVLIWLVALAATLARRARRPSVTGRRVTLVLSLAIAISGTLLVVVPAMGGGEVAAASTSRLARPAAITANASTQASDEVQVLIAAAPAGTSVEIPAGTYRGRIVIDKPLVVEAAGRVVLDGGGRGTVVTITSDDVTLRGFHVANTGGQIEEGAAIKVVEAARVTLERNHLESFYTGIAALGATDLHIRDNTLVGSGQVSADAGHAVDGSSSGQSTMAPDAHADHAGHADAPPDPAAGPGPRGQGDGISLWNTQATTIASNHIVGVRDGIYLSYADAVLADSNEVRSSRYAVHSMFGAGITLFGNHFSGNLAGIVLMYSKDVLVGRNAVIDHRSAGTGVGVAIKDVAGMRLAENVIARNRVGLRLEGTQRTAGAEATVLRNRISANSIGVSLTPSADVGFAANTFEGNLNDVYAAGQNVARRNDWSYQGTGNRWSAYAGYDLDADGVGDVPHTAGGVLQVVIAAAPALEVFGTSPALHVLASAQGLWELDRGAIVTDHSPRTDDPAPVLADLTTSDRAAAGFAGDSPGWFLMGLIMASLTGVGVAATRARRVRGTA